MRRFFNNQRVRVLEPDTGLQGRVGTVVRLRMSDNGAWVQMDEALPDELRAFPANDPRGNHILLFPEQCAAASADRSAERGT
jgi:hypothetical protein